MAGKNQSGSGAAQLAADIEANMKEEQAIKPHPLPDGPTCAVCHFPLAGRSQESINGKTFHTNCVHSTVVNKADLKFRIKVNAYGLSEAHFDKAKIGSCRRCGHRECPTCRRRPSGRPRWCCKCQRVNVMNLSPSAVKPDSIPIKEMEATEDV